MTGVNVSTGSHRSGMARRHPAKPIARRLHVWRWVWAVVVTALLAWFGLKIAQTPSLHWGVIGHYLFFPQILSGVRNTIIVSVLAQSIGIVGGLLLALCRLSHNPVLKAMSGGYRLPFPGRPTPVPLCLF